MFKNCKYAKFFKKNNVEQKDGPTFDYPQNHYNFNKLKVDHNWKFSLIDEQYYKRRWQISILANWFIGLWDSMIQ
jgi:hypothetical protein